jgi:hypothetical protein
MIFNKRLVTIGSNRNIELLNREEVSIQSENAASFLDSNTEIQVLFPNQKVLVIGFVLYGYPILYSEETTAKVYCNNATGTLCIAENYAVLNAILDLIELVWKGKEAETHLVKNDANLAIRKETLAKISALSPNADLSFWDWIAFEELSIGLQ